jgi:hypothetical protein
LVTQFKKNVKTDKYDHDLDLKGLSEKLNELNSQELHKRRHDLERIYWVNE